MAVVYVTKETFEQEVLKNTGTVLIDFYADWCGPCRMLSPVVEEISDEFPQYKVCKINIDKQPELANQFKVESIPTLFVAKNGRIVNRSVGVMPKAQILAMLG